MSVVSATVIVAGTMLAVQSNDVPPIVLAVSRAVAVAELPVIAHAIALVTVRSVNQPLVILVHVIPISHVSNKLLQS